MKKYLTILIFCLALALGFASTHPSNAQGNNRAGLVIQFGDGSIETRCIEFNEQTISGLEVLERSGLPVLAVYDPSLGAMVCKIQDQGCPVDNCLCKNPPDYWSYWHLNGNSWVYSPAGSSTYQVADGEVQGWSWGPGNPPPVMTIDEICTPPATEPPTNTPIPTNTQAPPTDTHAPTETPFPTDTPGLEPTTEPPPTDTQVPPTQSDSQSQDTQPPTVTPEPSTETPSPTFTPLATETQNQILPTDIPAPTITPEPTETFTLAQAAYPYPPQVTNAAPTSPPSYPYPPEPIPDNEQTVITLTPTLVPASTPPSEDTDTGSLLDQISGAIASARYPLLCIAWLFCGGTVAILLLGWVVILIRMSR